MRAVGLSDLDMAAWALLGLPAGTRQAAMTRMLVAAHCADKWRKRTGRAMPDGATGSLYVQAQLLAAQVGAGARAQAGGPAYGLALAVVLSEVQAWRGRMDQGS